MKPLVIFGAGELAELAHFYFGTLSHRKIAAFCLDADYIRNNHLMALPVVPFEEVAVRFPAREYDMFIAVGSSHVNRTRKDKYFQAKHLGYALASCISPHAIVHTKHVGDNCLIMDYNNIHPYVTIGNNVIFSNSNHIGHHSVIHDHCFITSNVVVSGGVTIGEGSFLGVNATIRDHITIGKYNVIGAGALIMSDTTDGSIFSVKATPAREGTSDNLDKL